MQFLKKAKIGKYCGGFVTVRDGIATVSAYPNGAESYQCRFPAKGTLSGAARIDSVAAAVKALGIAQSFGTIGDDYGGYHLVTIPAEDAPPISEIEGNAIEIDCMEFARAWQWAEIAAAGEKSRFGFRGICIDGSMLVGTDGKRLHYADVAGVDVSPKAIFPLIVGRFLETFATTGKMSLAIGDQCIMIRIGSASLWAQTVEGQYPDVRAVIPTERGTAVPMAPIAEHVRKAKAFTSVDSKNVRIETVGRSVVVRSQAPDIGRYDGETGIEADIVPVAFNPDYLLDACPKKTSPVMSWHSGKQPATVNVGDGRRAVLMPVTLRNA